MEVETDGKNKDDEDDESDEEDEETPKKVATIFPFPHSSWSGERAASYLKLLICNHSILIII